MKAGLDKDIILKTAADLADAEGIANVTLKALAEKLGVKPPSLYKHINGLEELNKALMLYGWKSLEKKVTRAAVGKSKEDAIRAIFYAYRDYV
ncbi:MAG: TetR/AcrR family transcriptional regulator, partial [Lachnospiraceae bacterium]|nr:TetR/AcrR family transcriptional regulator [Lachnospiraceae bacterium]